MARGVGKRIKTSFRQFNEDLQVLQKQIRHRSVYHRNKVIFARRSKHPKRNEEYLM